MGEAAGLVAIDSSPEGNDGAYTGVTLGQPGIGDGNTSPLFDGANDVNDVYSVPFNADFDGDEITIMIWIRAINIGVWADAANRYFIHLRADGNNRIYIRKSVAANTVSWVHAGSAVTNSANEVIVATTDWIVFALTITDTGDEIRFYQNGGQIGPVVNGIGAFVGALDPTLTVIGAFNNAPSLVWNGFLAHAAIWTTVLTPAEIADLAVV